MPKGTKRSGKVETGLVNFGSLGVAGESTVRNSKGQAVSGNPEGKRARVMVGDSGIERHRKAVADEARKITSTAPGTTKKVSESASNAASFRSAFAAAKKEGKASFTWNGRKYSTKSKG